MNATRSLLLLLALFVGCGSPASPTNKKASFVIVFTPAGGSYSVQFQGQTYTASGGFDFNLTPGTYTVSGTFTGTAFGIGFAAEDGGVQSGSLRSLSGPSPDVKSCSVLYFASGSQSRSFQLQFVVTNNTASVCQF